MSNTTRKKNISTILILAIVLLVPGFLYVALHKVGSNSYLKLPIYGDKVLSGEMKRVMGREVPDTIFHEIPATRFRNSNADTVVFLGQDTVITVAHLCYAKDEGLSRSLLVGLKPVVERFQHNPKVKFYSISVDSSDTVDKLNEIAERYSNSDLTNWSFVAGQDMDVLEFAQKELLLDAIRNENSTGFAISNNYILIDTRGRIRGFYDISLKTEVDRLQDEIRVQLVEEVRNNPLKVEKR